MKKAPIALILSTLILTACSATPTETIPTVNSSTPSSTSTSPISNTTNTTSGTTMPSDTSNATTGGTIEEQVDAYIEATEEIKETEEAEIEDTTPASTTPKYTVAEDPEEDNTPAQKVDTSTIKQGDYTAGGYLPTTANSKYRENGLKFWMDSGGILFRDGQTEDLYNWVSAGYTKRRTEDVRIASRKGGTDNPRIATYLSLDNNDNWFAEHDNSYCVVTVMKGTYTEKGNNISKELKELTEKYIQHGDETKESSKAMYKETDDYIATHDLDKEMNLYADSGEYNTMVTYNCRNYCGDTISIDPHGEGVVKTNIDPSRKDGPVTAAAGIDYILTCDEDPEAFKLVKEDELKQMYEAKRKGLNYYVGSAYNVNASYGIETMSGKTEAGVTNTYHQAYIGVKPGIYHCTLTIPSTGDKFDIVIENLPVHYEKLLWGCSTQEEMDFCVQFMQGWEYGLFGQYYHARSGQIGANLYGVNNNTANLKEKLEKVDKFNNGDTRTYEGESIQLKKKEEAAEWVAHLPCAAATACLEQQVGGLRLDTLVMEEQLYTGLHARCTSYDALDSIMYGAEDCESLSASVSCLWNVLGYTTRYVTGGNHAWFEVKVPASITKSGKDQWMMVDNGIIADNKSSIQKKSYVYDEVEGMDNSWWTECYNKEIRQMLIDAGAVDGF